MTAATTSPLSDVSRKVLQLQVITLIWMSAEAIVSLGTAWTSHSPALFAFGGDSLIELLSAAVVFWRFRFALSEARAARIAGGLLFALAGSAVLTSVLNFFGYREAQRSLIGIGILLAAASRIGDPKADRVRNHTRDRCRWDCKGEGRGEDRVRDCACKVIESKQTGDRLIFVF